MSKDKNGKEKLMYWVSVNNWNQRMKVERKKPNVIMLSHWKCDDLWLSLIATFKVQFKLKDEKF